MPRDPATPGNNQELAELLRDLLITTLGVAGVKQSEIRKVVRCDIGRVNRILKHIPKERKNAE